MKERNFVFSQKLARKPEGVKRPTAGDEPCEVTSRGEGGGVPPFIEKIRNFFHRLVIATVRDCCTFISYSPFRRIQFAALVLFLSGNVLMAADAGNERLKANIRAVEQAAKAGGRQACMTTVLNRNLSQVMVEDMKNTSSNKISGSLRAIIGGRNFTSADIDVAQVPFYTLSGLGGNPILLDGGTWPGTGGNPNNDDGQPTAGVDQAGEIYDLDKNGHYPKAVLRYIGAHCYIFVPVMFFPTLPRGISATEDATPPAKSEWGMYWPDTAGWGSGIYYFAAATGSTTLEPRSVLGSDKNLARLKLKELADEFDGNIYPRVREYFGSEPDVDGDPKVFILLDDIRDGQGSFRGYVWKANELPNSVYPKSNEKEIIHLDLFPTFTTNAKQGYRTMAHEFTHLICFNEGDIVNGSDIDQQETWIEEGVAQYASHVYDKSHTTNSDEFIKNPDTPLTQWNDSYPFNNYGASYMWIFYLAEHFGKSNLQTFMRSITREKNRGVAAMDSVLKGFTTTFADTFANWALANIIDKTRKLDGSPLEDGKWGYLIDNDFDTTNDMGVNEHLPMKFSEQIILSPTGAVRSSDVNAWAADYIQISGNTGNLNLGFDGDDRTQFRAAVVKRGPQIDTAVEFFNLSDKQAGNLIIQNYGAGNSYENLILVPMITSSANNNKSNYVYSATFGDLKVAMFPNPIFENELHIIVRTSDKFSSVPRLQVTFGGEQGYLTMTPVNPSTYLTNYHVKTSGEGELEANGTTSNGTILSNRLKFSAVYYPPKSAGLLSASFGSLDVPKGSLKSGGLVSLAANMNRFSPVGLKVLTPSFDVGLPGGAPTETPITLKVPFDAGLVSSSTPIGLFEIQGNKMVFLQKAVREGNQARAEVSRSGSLFLAADLDAPRMKNEVEAGDNGWIAVEAADIGAGIDPGSLEVTCQNRRVPAKYDEKTQQVLINSNGIGEGKADFDVSLADRLGNQVKSRISAQVAGVLALADYGVYPSPARAFAKFRAAFKGASSGSLSVEATVHDVSGDEVMSSVLSYKGSGVYETTWDLISGDGGRVANGVYYLELRASGDGPEIKVRRKFAVLR